VLVIKCGLKLSVTLYRPDIRYFSTNISLSYRIINAGCKPDDLTRHGCLAEHPRQWVIHKISFYLHTIFTVIVFLNTYVEWSIYHIPKIPYLTIFKNNNKVKITLPITT